MIRASLSVLALTCLGTDGTRVIHDSFDNAIVIPPPARGAGAIV